LVEKVPEKHGGKLAYFSDMWDEKDACEMEE
jgi:hypothetical protein